MKFPWQKLTQDDVDHSFTDKSLPGEYDDQYVLLQKINKVYSNKFHAVHDFSLCVKKKEFVVFVGPSGCGKSTTLRMIAGLEDISSGNLFINGEYANNLLAKDRDIAMVFQNYALYPNMTVFDNMAFALKVRKHDFPVVKLTNEELYKKEVEETINQLEAEKNDEIAQLKLNGATKEDIKDYLYLYGLYKKLTIRYIRKKYEVQVMTFDHEEVRRLNFVLKDEKNPNKVEEIKNKIASIKANLNVPQFKRRHYKKEEIIDRVYNAANILEIFDQLKKKPKELSGGQRQRVALGRAIVRNAKIFLMDEPLSNLDAKLRVQMRSEIIELHKKINATTIYVTHDQTEAMTMADRIVVMKDGYIQQIGTPMEIYQHPRNLFVASFIGSPAMNILEGTYNCGSITFPDGTTIKLNEEIIKKHDEFYAQKYADETNNYSAFKEQLMEEKTLFDSKKHSGKEIEEFYGKYNKLIQDKDELIANLKKIIHNEPHDIIFGIRPESIVESEEKGSMKVNVRLSELLGDQYFVHFDFGGKDILSKVSADKLIPSGVTMSLLISEDKIHLFDAYSKMTIV